MGIWETGVGVGAGVSALYALRKWRESQWETCTTRQRIDGLVAVITGANAGLGRILAEDLASRGAFVVLACRNVVSAGEAVSEIRERFPQAQLDVVQLDLSSMVSVRHCAAVLLERYPKINILVNNAGVSIPPKMGVKTHEGHEINFGVNHLGHFLLTHLLAERLRSSTPSRVIVVSSKLHEQGVLDWDAMEGLKPFEASSRGPNVAYSSSKLANVLFGIRLSEKLAGQGVKVYTCCPGWNYTKLFRYSSVPLYSWIFVLPIAFWFMKPARIGVNTLIHCAVSEDVAEESGKFYRECKVYQSQAKDLSVTSTDKLWELSCRLCGVEW